MDIVPSSSSTSSKSTTLFYLPEEIIVLILQFLRPDQPPTTFPPLHPSSSSYTDLLSSWTKYTPPPWPIPTVPRSLYAFSLVSKRANQLVAPLLYNAITLQTIDITKRLALHLEEIPSDGLSVKHLLIPHDGLMHSPSDRPAADEDWAASWRSILAATPRLESLYLFTRPSGKALQEVLNHSSQSGRDMSSLQRLTIGSLSYSVPIVASGSINASCLTHLHLMQWTPSTLNERFGGRVYQSLRYLRLSRLSAVGLKALAAIGKNTKGTMKAQDILHQSAIDQHPILLLLRQCIEQSSSLEIILLELHELAGLNMPEDLIPWGATMHPAIVDKDEPPFDEVKSWPVEGAEKRMEYWSTIHEAKILLAKYSKQVRGPHYPPIDFRIVAPRAGGWDRNEFLIDFHANAAACRGGIDRSAFMDEDVFELVDRYPYLGHDHGYDPSGKRVAYWTGAMPKRKASKD